MILPVPGFDEFAEKVVRRNANLLGDAIRERTGSGAFIADDATIRLGSELSEQEFGGDPFVFDSIMDMGAKP